MVRARLVARGAWRVARDEVNDPRSPDAVQYNVAGSCVAHSGVANPHSPESLGSLASLYRGPDAAGARVNLPTNLWFSRPLCFLFYGLLGHLTKI